MNEKIIFTNGLIDLAQPRLGTKVIYKTDDFFASANRVISPTLPVFKEGVFDKHGKWMDGWESRRKRTSGHDYIVLKLGKPGKISKIDVGRSNIVGRPISILTSLNNKGANGTCTICHSRTKNLEYFTKNADVIIMAIGIPNYLKGNMIKKDAVVIDVGINRVTADNEKGYEIIGDVDWDSITDKVSAITPVPGGVGPMTIAMLIENTLEAAENMDKYMQL